MNTNRLAQKDRGWRTASFDWVKRADQLIVFLDQQPNSLRLPSEDGKDPFLASDVVRRLVHLISAKAGNVRAEERFAWDSYFAAARIAHPDRELVEVANDATRMLEERRRVFSEANDDGDGKQPA